MRLTVNTKLKSPVEEFCWMAWSPASNYLPQAASVDREVCKQMIKEWGWSKDVRPVRVRLSPPRRRTSQ
jgi:hypothetical protein